MDVFDQKTRSEVMSRIRSKNTRPELFVRKLLFSDGFRYRLHVKKLPGCPDLVFAKYRTVIFVHGCFWHSHLNCRKATKPSDHASYWAEKLRHNKERDLRTKTELLNSGWRVLIVWECACKKKHSMILCQKMSYFIQKSNKNFMEIGATDLEVQDTNKLL